ncbi:MAG: glutaredoxin family protein [Patescibacteria group bacterium]|nr:glutaredoxin family protein [Patescibacteria group bacterium]
MKVVIYSTPTCPYCLQAKSYFESKNIDYTNIDVSTDQKAAQEMVDLSGQMGVPVITINDKVVIGFDKSKIEALLISNE